MSIQSDKESLCETVATPNFPAYAIAAISGRYVIVAGGGGASRTGIKNKFDIYELYHNGKQTKAERVVSHDVGAACIGNLAGWTDVIKNETMSSPVIHLALGQDEKCVLLKLTPKLDSTLPVDEIILDAPDEVEDSQNLNTGVRQRIQEVKSENQRFKDMKEAIAKKRKHERMRRESINSTLRGEKYFTFDIEEICSRDTVFSKSAEKNESFEEIYQKIVTVFIDNQMLVTGGTDGIIRFWSLPKMEKIREIKAHKKEVDDLDFKCDGKQIVSICKPTRECSIWNVKDGKNVINLEHPTNGVKYKFFRARYGAKIPTSSKPSSLFTISNALMGSKNPSILSKWNAKTYVREKSQNLKGTLSSLSISDDARFVATGTMDGGVYIIIAFSLQLLQKVDDAHTQFVTGLAWLPTDTKESKMVRGFSDASVLSISCDKTVKIHHIPRPYMLPVWIVALLSVVVLFGAFVFASYIGL